MLSWDATRRVAEEGCDDRLDDACDGCATGLRVRVRVPSPRLTSRPRPRGATRHGLEPRGKLGSLSTSRQYPNNSHALCEVRGIASRTLSWLERRVAVFLFGNTASLYSPPSLASARAAHFRLARLDSWSAANSNSVGLGVAIRHSHSCLRCIQIQGHPRATLHYDPHDYIYLSSRGILLTQLNSISLGHSLFCYTYSVIRDARLHARTQEGYFYFSVLYCSVVYLISLGIVDVSAINKFKGIYTFVFLRASMAT
jgi:hypothetical protein